MALAWPLIQCQLLVSTAWGALYYREQRGRRQVSHCLIGYQEHDCPRSTLTNVGGPSRHEPQRSWRIWHTSLS